MPYIPYSPWAEIGQAGRGLGQSVGDIMFQIPQVRAQQQQRKEQLALQAQQLAAHAALWQKQGAHAEAQTEKLKQETGDLVTQAQAVKEYQRSMKRLGDAMQTNQVTPEIIGDFFKSGAALDTKNLHQQAQALVQLFGAANAGVAGNPDRAMVLAGGDPRKLSVQTAQGAVRTPTSQPGVVEGGFTLRPGEQRFAPQMPMDTGGFKLDLSAPLNTGGRQVVASVPPLPGKPVVDPGQLPPGMGQELVSIAGKGDLEDRIPQINAALAAAGRTNRVQAITEGVSDNRAALKAKAATKLHLENPKLTRQQIIDLVNKQFGE